MAVIAVVRLFREKLGEEETDASVVLINEAGANDKEKILEVVEERFERRLAEELGKVRMDMTEGMSKLRTEMADLRANLVQWMFLFWIGQSGVLTGILFAFFRK